MTTQLGVYNQALVTHLGERKLTALDSPATEASQIALDTVWDQGAVDTVLEMGYWNFATRSVQISYNSSITPSFGYQYAFDKPSDLIATAAISADGSFRTALNDYMDEGSYWFAGYSDIFVKYVSNDSSFGADMSLWPQSFEKVLACYLAVNTCRSITKDRVKKIDLDMELDRLLTFAKAKDALAQPPRRGPKGSWVKARSRNVTNEY